METAAPNSPKRSKFSWKRGVTRLLSSAGSSCIALEAVEAGRLAASKTEREFARRPGKPPCRPNKEWDAAERASIRLQQRLNGRQIGIFFRQFPKGFVHLKTCFEINPGILDVAEQSLVTTHVIIVNRFFQQRGRAPEQKGLGFRGLAKFVQAKAGMKKSCAAVRRGMTELPADAQGLRPPFVAH